MSYVDELKKYLEEYDTVGDILIDVQSAFNAPNCDIHGGGYYCCTLEQARKIIAREYQQLWTEGFEDNPNHAWLLSAYEIFQPTEIVDGNNSVNNVSTFRAVILCYYKPANPDFMNAFVIASHEAEMERCQVNSSPKELDAYDLVYSKGEDY